MVLRKVLRKVPGCFLLMLSCLPACHSPNAASPQAAAPAPPADRGAWSAVDLAVGPYQIAKGATSIVWCPAKYLSQLDSRTEQMETWQKVLLPVSLPVFSVLDYVFTAYIYVASGIGNTLFAGLPHRSAVQGNVSDEEPNLSICCMILDQSIGYHTAPYVYLTTEEAEYRRMYGEQKPLCPW